MKKNKHRVFIDGSAGTTGLRIHSRLQARDDIEVLSLPEECRKDPAARAEMYKQADVAFLCLPDRAAIDAVEMMKNAHPPILIDTSTAHRVSDGWIYGFPEIGDYRERIASDEGPKMIANPGCHASGVIALLYPLIKEGLIKKDLSLSATSITGYSGGGKAMIAEYRKEGISALYDAPRAYALGQNHKHLPEILSVTGLEKTPILCPIVAPYYAGMEVIIPLFADDLQGTSRKNIEEVYANHYGCGSSRDRAGLIRFIHRDSEEGFLSASAYAGRDDMAITLQGNDDRMLLIARFDNLGKGASGAAIQNMNLALGLAETTGLYTGEQK